MKKILFVIAIFLSSSLYGSGYYIGSTSQPVIGGGSPPTISNAVEDNVSNPDVTPYTLSQEKVVYVHVAETVDNITEEGTFWNTTEQFTFIAKTSNASSTPQYVATFYLDGGTLATDGIVSDSTASNAIPGAYEISGAASGAPNVLATYTVDETASTFVISGVTPTSANSLLVLHFTWNNPATVNSVSDNIGSTWTGQVTVGANSSHLLISSSPSGSTSSRDITVIIDSALGRPTCQILEFLPSA